MSGVVNIENQQSKTIGDILTETLGCDLSAEAVNPIAAEMAVRELGKCIETDMLDGTLLERFTSRLGNRDQALYAAMALKNVLKYLE